MPPSLKQKIGSMSRSSWLTWRPPSKSGRKWPNGYSTSSPEGSRKGRMRSTEGLSSDSETLLMSLERKDLVFIPSSASLKENNSSWRKDRKWSNRLQRSSFTLNSGNLTLRKRNRGNSKRRWRRLKLLTKDKLFSTGRNKPEKLID